MRRLLSKSVLLLLSLLLTFTASIDAQKNDEINGRAKQWHFLLEEHRIQKLHADLSKEFRQRNLAFTRVNLVTMKNETILSDQTVLVRNGRISEIARTGKIRIPRDFLIIEGQGRYLAPGLTDMHVHNLVSNSQHLLNLAHGITTVRDMCGFPYLLEARKKISANQLLAPNMYVAGHILNARPMDMYATVVKSIEDAKRIVNEQKAAGYDFIKIHNNMPEDLYTAILQESKAQKIDVVGHIPHDLNIRKAIEHGQRTLEHFKGYYLDRSLTLTTENYVEATRGANVWNCPTLYTYREHLRGEAARKLLSTSEEMKYVSWREKKDWLQLARNTSEENLQGRQNILPMSNKIFKDLLLLPAKFVTGTDSGGGYPFMIPGFALHEELFLFQENGMSPAEIMLSTTRYAAEAMRKEAEFGTIEIGKRADLLLLRSNPLQDASNARTIEGVAVRGIWLSRSDLDRILRRVEEIYNPPGHERVIKMPSRKQIEQFIQEQKKMQAEGFVFRTHDLEAIQKLQQNGKK